MHSATTVYWGSSSHCSLACHALHIKRGLKPTWKYSVWLQHLLLWCCSESQAEGRDEALGDPLVTSTSSLLSLLPPCGDSVLAALRPLSEKQRLDMKGYPFSACDCLLYFTQVALSNTLIFNNVQKNEKLYSLEPIWTQKTMCHFHIPFFAITLVLLSDENKDSMYRSLPLEYHQTLIFWWNSSVLTVIGE